MPERTIPKISMNEFNKLIFIPNLFNKNNINGTMAIDKASDKISRSITSISFLFQKTQLQTKPGKNSK